MAEEKRQHPRYEEIGKVFSQEICALPGVLDDISLNGCKFHYSFPVVVDLESEYDVKISPLHQMDSSPLNLVCQPQWVNEIDGNTLLGMKILYSPDKKRLESFVETLERDLKNQTPDIL